MRPVLRWVVPTALVLAAATVIAQSPPAAAPTPAYQTRLTGADISLGEARFLFYKMLAGESSRDPLGLAQQYGLQAKMRLDDAAYQALLEYMRRTVDEVLAYEAEQRRSLCARRQQLTTVQQLGVAMNDDQRQLDVWREQLKDDVPDVLGTDGKARLLELVQNFRRGSIVTRVDNVEDMIERKTDPVQLLASLCRDAAGGGSPGPAAYSHILHGADIPLAEAQYSIYASVVGSGYAKPDTQWVSHVQNQLQIGGSRWQALLTHMRATVKASQALDNEQTKALCARRAELTSVQSLGAAMNEDMKQMWAHQAELMRGADSILDAQGRESFARFVEDYRRGMTINHIDFAGWMAATHADPAERMDAMCRQAASPPAFPYPEEAAP